MYERQHGDELDFTRPDPALARTGADFIVYLRRLKLWAGDPSFRELQRRSGVPASTLSDALNRKLARLPRLDVIRAFVSACGVGLADQARWVATWRALRLEEAATTESASARPSTTAFHRDPRVVDRDHAIARLDAVLREHRAGRRRSPLVLITGTSTAAASATARSWMRRQSATFPDGRLYLDLRSAAGGAGHAGLSMLLRQLGVLEDEIPVTPDARAGLYRSISRERTFLVLLDNATDADHLRPLLPEGPACYTLITSTAPLFTLASRHDAVQLSVGRGDQVRGDRASTDPRSA
ncbi:hypothetical protein E1262_05380 [Jiangella aurantiaca]|uniref:XRE family transcriptional regulator n=1 Tax=Jiangella aurantiaca TaxID=2530373 RepID=A0A4R5AMX8_9ACTN|nr:hypothetical protein [Jiangella aurantiaca]TDD71582.1 hypothetical protein E1262_05380 [Jiangella aurantiaca]